MIKIFECECPLCFPDVPLSEHNLNMHWNKCPIKFRSYPGRLSSKASERSIMWMELNDTGVIRIELFHRDSELSFYIKNEIMTTELIIPSSCFDSCLTFLDFVDKIKLCMTFQ